MSITVDVVEDFGAVGDGSTDDTAAIQEAIDAVAAAGGGVVLFPPLTYSIRLAQTQGASWCLKIVTDGVTLRGKLPTGAVLKLKALQPLFCRMFEVIGAADFLADQLTLDGSWHDQNWQNNQAEQQHGFFFSGCARPVVQRCAFISNAGDSVYWHNACTFPVVTHCTFRDELRVGVHAQHCSDGIIRRSKFRDCPGNRHVAAEPDVAPQKCERLLIESCSFAGDLNAAGILINGASLASPSSGITVRRCRFRGLLYGVGLGVYSWNWVIEDCTMVDVVVGVGSINYALQYGYQANVGIEVRRCRIQTRAGDTQSGLYPVTFGSSSDAVVADCRIKSLDGDSGIGLLGSSGIELTDLVVDVGGQNAQGDSYGVNVYRSSDIAISGCEIHMRGPGRKLAVYVSDDAVTASTGIEVHANLIDGELLGAVVEGERPLARSNFLHSGHRAPLTGGWL